MLNKHQLLLVAEFLEELSIIQGNAGCNDYEMENTEENWALLQLAERWHSKDPETWTEKRPASREKIQTWDHIILGYLKHLVEEQATLTALDLG